MKLYYGALTSIVAGGFLVSGCGTKTCADGSQPPTGVCPVDCDEETEFYDDDTFTCVEITDEDCDDEEDNDGDGDIDCRDDDCDGEDACIVDWVPDSFVVETFYGWDPAGDGGSGAAVPYTVDGNAQNPVLIFEIYTTDYSVAGDNRYACDIIAEYGGNVNKGAFTSDAGIAIGWVLPNDATWTSDFPGSANVPAGCATIEGVTMDLQSVFGGFAWGTGIGDIGSDASDIVDDQVPEWADYAVGGGFYSDALAGQESYPGGFFGDNLALPMVVNESFELQFDSDDEPELVESAQALTGGSALAVRGIGAPFVFFMTLLTGG